MQYNNLIHHTLNSDHNTGSNPSELSVGFPEQFEGSKHRDSVLLGARAVNVLVQTQQEARTDHLTGLPNKRAFDEGLEQLIGEMQFSESPNLALAYFDLDNFKDINDDNLNGGHDVGDRVLATVAQILQQRLKLRRGEIIARTGGDEFAAVLITKNTGNNRRVIDNEDNILKGFVERAENDVRKLAEEIGMNRLGVSIGVVKYQNGESVEEFKKRADVAMYEIKRAKKEHR